MLRTLAAASAAAFVLKRLWPHLEQLVHRLTSTVQLQYFDIPGLGEPIRFALVMAGVVTLSGGKGTFMPCHA